MGQELQERLKWEIQGVFLDITEGNSEGVREAVNIFHANVVMYIKEGIIGGKICDELITRPEESYRMWRVVVCDLETSRMKRPALGCSATVGGELV